jgi:hypothetical protein
MPARLEDEQSAHMVSMLEGEALALEDRAALERRGSRRHDSERLAACVVVDCLEPHYSSENDG